MSFISDLLIEISSFRIRVGNKLNALANRIGDLTALTTTNKNSLVEAVNEVNDSIPNVTGLVPYTGATSNVDLNYKRLSNVSILDIVLNSMTYPNATNSNVDAWNQSAKNYFSISSGNNRLAIIGESTQNARKFGLQVGHTLPAYANAPGTLELQPLHGDVRIGSLSGSGVRMVVADSTGIVSSQAIPTDNYLRLGSHTTSQDQFQFIGGDTFNLRNTIAWATSSANRPNDTNSAIVAFTPYKAGTSEYGFFLGARHNRLWLSTLENSTPSGWVEIAKRSEFDNYLPLAGGTMLNTASINWSTIGALSIGGNSRLRFSNANTILSSENGGMIYFRPQGDSVNTVQVTIDGDGQINTSYHGNSSQWNHEEYQLGTTSNLLGFNPDFTGVTTTTKTSFFGLNGSFFGITNTNRPQGILVKGGVNDRWSWLGTTDIGAVRVFAANSSNPTTPVELYHTGNFNPAQYVLQTSLNAQLANYATLGSVQTITATKTFTVSPIVPNGTLSGHTVNLGQMQAYVASQIPGNSGIERIQTDNSTNPGPAEQPTLYFNFHEYMGMPETDTSQDLPGNMTARASGHQLDFFGSYDNKETIIEDAPFVLDFPEYRKHIIDLHLTTAGDVYVEDGMFTGDQVNIVTHRGAQINLDGNIHFLNAVGAHEFFSFVNLEWDASAKMWNVTAFN